LIGLPLQSFFFFNELENFYSTNHFTTLLQKISSQKKKLYNIITNHRQQQAANYQRKLIKEVIKNKERKLPQVA